MAVYTEKSLLIGLYSTFEHLTRLKVMALAVTPAIPIGFARGWACDNTRKHVSLNKQSRVQMCLSAY